MPVAGQHLGHLALLSKLRRVFANDQYPVAQREALVGIIRNRCVERRLSDLDARRGSGYPSDMLVMAIPHLDAQRQVRRDVMEVGVCQLAQQSLDAVIMAPGAL